MGTFEITETCRYFVSAASSKEAFEKFLESSPKQRRGYLSAVTQQKVEGKAPPKEWYS